MNNDLQLLNKDQSFLKRKLVCITKKKKEKKRKKK